MKNDHHLRRKTSIDYSSLEPRNLLASFSGTNGEDLVIVTFENGVPRFVEINGKVFDNHDATADIDLLYGQDEIRFVGQAFEVEVIGDPIVNSEVGIGNANQVLDFKFQDELVVRTGSENDTIQVTGGEYIYEPFGWCHFNEVTIYTGGGDDTVNWLDGTTRVFTQGGNDHLNVFGRVSQLEFESQIHALMEFDGGDGYDTWQFVDQRGQLEISRIDENGQVVFGNQSFWGSNSSEYSGIEKIIAPSPTGASKNVVFPRTGGIGLDLLINGSSATAITNNRLTVSLELENFNQFRSHPKILGPDKVSILETAYSLDFHNYDRVEIGFQGDASTGSNQGIRHNIRINKTDNVVTSYSMDGPQEVVVDRSTTGSGYQIENGGHGVIHFTEAKQATIWGSDFNDRFFALANDSKLVVYGRDGDDDFSASNIFQSDLDNLKGDFVVFNGGEGADVARVRDRKSTRADLNYLLREGRVNSIDNENSGEVREFVGLRHSNIERLQLDANAGFFIGDETANNHVSAKASLTTAYFLNAANSDSAFELFDSAEELNSITNGNRTFYRFRSGLKQITIAAFDSAYGFDRLAIGSARGESPLVEVFNPVTEHRYSFEPFPETAKLGTHVAAGHLRGLEPQIAVAPATGGNRIKIFSFNSSTQETTLIASQLTFDDYNGGLNIEMGNVLGDLRDEIIVSKANGGNDVQIYSAVPAFPLGFELQLVHEFNPFANAPDIGTRLALGDQNGDGYDDIYAAAGPGWLPQVAIFSINDNGHRQLSRFLAAGHAYDQGLTIESGNLVRGPGEEVLVALLGTGTSRNETRIFDAGDLPANAGGTVLEPNQTVRIFGGSQQIQLETRDENFDGLVDRVYATMIGDNINKRIKTLDRSFDLIDSIFAEDERFLNGMNLG